LVRLAWRMTTVTDDEHAPFFSRYLAELLAERHKLNPFVPVLPHSIRLLNQGELSCNQSCHFYHDKLVGLLLPPHEFGIFSCDGENIWLSPSVWFACLFFCFTPPFIFLSVRCLWEVALFIHTATDLDLPHQSFFCWLH
jgi:hypothetical protein